ncbi:MAG: GDP-mannose 4,6-dehydratase [Bacteroidota bacterium]|nr:GDP-mannose 4,6-dehydratase [Bacteroidota bacterium]
MEKPNLNMEDCTPETGIIECFQTGDYKAVERAISDIKEIGIGHIRIEISWAEWSTPEGQTWFDWLIPKLSKNLSLLPCFLPVLPKGIKKTSSSPVNSQEYADFLDLMITRYGIYFDWLELWNHQDDINDWNKKSDSQWSFFAKAIENEAKMVQARGKKTVLGGISPTNLNCLKLLFETGVMKNIDAIGIHKLSDEDEAESKEWELNIEKIQGLVNINNSPTELWITQSGFSTWKFDETRQLQEYLKSTDQKVKRTYWYSLYDFDTAISITDNFDLEDKKLHYGMKKRNGAPKLIYRFLQNESLEEIKKKKWLTQEFKKNVVDKHILITGGAGFVGINLAHHYLLLGKPVMIFDNLSRPGVVDNLQWLISKYGTKVRVQIADIRNESILQMAVKNAESVYHFAAQAGATSSIYNPIEDFEINARGTLNILNSIALLETPIPLVFASSSKVYGEMKHLEMKIKGNSYEPVLKEVKSFGINENSILDLNNPYGCSKGVAEQYVLDFARTFQLPATVFRISSTYGPYQHGNEEQGWLSHFISNCIKNKTVNIYGDGRQVRDILFIDDLVEALLLTQKNMSSVIGQAFNIGGGPQNAISLIDALEMISKISKNKIDVSYNPWRTGEQRYFVSDTRKFELATGWIPKTNIKNGMEALYNWISNHKEAKIDRTTIKNF